jgi:toxin secretion/phage lysis holin
LDKHHAVSLSAGVIGGIVNYAFGGWNGLLEILFLAIALDYITGVACAFKEKNLHSEIGFWGLIKKVLMVVAVFFGHRADLAFGTTLIQSGMIIGFLTNEIISLAENYGRLGLPMSQYIQPVISILKQKGGANDAGKE